VQISGEYAPARRIEAPHQGLAHSAARAGYQYD